MRVVSLLPSATEILCELGASALLVGRSHECDHPPGIADVPALTAQRTTATDSAEIDRQVREALGGADPAASLYHLDAAALEALRPDVILTQDLCDVCSIDLETVRGVARTMSPTPTVVATNPLHLDDVLDDVARVADAIGWHDAGRAAVARLRDRIARATAAVPAGARRPEVAFIEWLSPLFVGGHWTPELIALAGGNHSLNPAGARSRTVTAETLVASAPEAIVIAPCGFDLPATTRELHHLVDAPWWRDLPAVRSGRVALVDGSAMFNRPGPRLVDALEWLVAWLHDGATAAPPGFPAIPLP